MAERTEQELGRLSQKPHGLMSPERSGSPDLESRSSQRGQNRVICASREDAHQIDDWPGAYDRKSENILVRYKDTRGSKGLSSRMDPHAWSDLPTDTDDELDDVATTSSDGNGDHAGKFTPKLVSPKAYTRTVHRTTESEVKIWSLASEESWDRPKVETIELDGTASQQPHLPDTENEHDGSAKVLTCVKKSRKFSKAPLLEYEKDFSSDHEVGGAGEKLEGGLEHGFKKVLTQATISKAFDEQASIKMSRQYYSSGSSNSSRRRSMPQRGAAEGCDSGVKNTRLNQKQRVESGMLILADSRFKFQRVAVNKVDCYKELGESTTSADSDCNDMVYSSGGADNEEDVEESYRQMALHKHVKLHGKTRKKRWSKIKIFSGQFKALATDHMHSGVVKERTLVSRSINSTSQNDLLKNSNPLEPPDTRNISPQPAESLQENQFNKHLIESTQTLEAVTEEKRPQWLRDEFQQFVHSVDICALKVPRSQSRSRTSLPEIFTEQRHLVDFDGYSGRNSKIAGSEASNESCFATSGIILKNHVEVCPPTVSEIQSRVRNPCIRTLDFSPNTKELLLKNNETEKATSPEEIAFATFVTCDRLTRPIVPTTGKADGVQRSFAVEALDAPEYQCEGRDMEQCERLGSPVLDCKSDSKDDNAVEMLKMDCDDGEDTHRADVTFKNCCKGSTEESRNSFEEVTIFFDDEVAAVAPLQSNDNDQSLPNVYQARQPVSLTSLELRKEVEETKLVNNEIQQEKILQRVAEQQLGAQQINQHKPALSEARLNSQNEQQILLKRLQELNAYHPCNRLKAMSRTSSQLTEEDARKLRQEILEQEALIRGYQVENEKAVAKLNEIQLDAKKKLQEMAEEKAFLASQLSNRQMQSGHQSWVHSAESVSLNEALRSALSRESALRIDLDKVRESYLGLKMHEKRKESGRIRSLESKLTALQELLEMEKQGHAQMEGIKQATRQQEELILSLQSTISDQASKIRLLTTELESGGEAQKTEVSESNLIDHKQNANNDMTQNQIQSLQNQVKRLEASLRAAKKETGLHALKVSKSCVEENDKFRRLQMELVSVQRQALQKDEETNRILHRLKIENDKIKSESATRIRNLKQQTQAQSQNVHSVSETERAALNRVKDLEKQLANLRIHYSRKLKDLTDKLSEAKQEPKSKDSMRSKMIPDRESLKSKVANTHPQPAQDKSLREAKERIVLTEDVLIQKDRTIKSLQNKIENMEAARAGLCKKFSATGASATTESIGAKQGSPTREVHRSEPEQLQSQESSNSRTQLLNSNSIVADAADEVVALRMELEKSELTREVLQKTCDESVEKAVFLTLQHQQAHQLQQIRRAHRDCNSECQTSLAGWTDHRSDPEGSIWRSEPSSLELTNRALEARLKVMSEELEEAQSMFRQSPRMTQIMKLKKKVKEMEARQQQREIEWQNILRELKQATNKDQEYTEHKWHQAFDAKSKEVEKIRLELNSILETARSIQHAQIQKHHET